ncbi:hypothetical protein N478_16220 [Pseudoalteromonas luteoviolacea S4060-1]|uniref:Uncharacterized protein n=1 Tax=Pseudoalteromonas luteoviolacea S4060-1 TaxID=1365257 RepID=A0A167N937_9GAMM|nr:hypothetical protein N478_16220 [Pseudoalteromonas luteoviolacea S4060-1]
MHLIAFGIGLRAENVRRLLFMGGVILFIKSSSSNKDIVAATA